MKHDRGGCSRGEDALFATAPAGRERGGDRDPFRGPPGRSVDSDQAARKRQFRHDRGRFEVPDDFDAPLPPEVLADLE